ncbi:MAG: class I SAM-dependent methyltransferase [Deltaproteobacteria bacterium]|nr:MAG: class I SAM-dependent methyltransferase [Deltaproteobacteria bacterium]
MFLPKDLDLHDKETSEHHYDEKYAHKAGFLSQEYMAEWKDEKKDRITDLIAKLSLPPKGEALDFGCGSGVLTEVIRKALPGYQVYGTDLSQAALDKARERYPGCTFFHADDARYNKKKFDFLFTHHVLEHVYDLQEVAGEIAHYLKPAAVMLHILPCGNEGSLEYNLCLLREDGFNPQKGGVFFFEDDDHVRRIKTEDIRNLFLIHNCILVEDYYSNQYFGAIKWITESNPFKVLKMFNPLKGRDSRAKMQLIKLGSILTGLNLWRMPITLLNRLKQNQQRGLVSSLLYNGCLLLYPLSRLLDRYVRRLAAAEWRQGRKERNGSEMYLIYSRSGRKIKQG